MNIHASNPEFRTPMSVRLAAAQRFVEQSGFVPSELVPIQGDASFRHYIRVLHARSPAILMDAPPGREDVRPYLKVARALKSQGYSAPLIHAEEPQQGFVLLEDMGPDMFAKVLEGKSELSAPDSEQVLYSAAVDLLVDWHTGTMRKRGTSLELADYDHALLLEEAALFSDWFLPHILGEEEAKKQRPSYLALWEEIFRQVPVTGEMFVHRDYHADNLIWLPKRFKHAKVGLLDFQDAVWGHAAYDLASLLEDARRDVPPALAKEMIARYIAAAKVKEQDFRNAYAVLAAQRNSKIIGIFMRLSKRDGKHGYRNLLPRVWKLLERDVKAHPALAPLGEWLDAHVPPQVRGS